MLVSAHSITTERTLLSRSHQILQPDPRVSDFADVTCIGSISPAEVYTVDDPLKWDKGSDWNDRADFLSDDAVIVASSLSSLGWSVGLVTNRLGDDVLGENVVSELRRLGIKGTFILDSSLETPYEIVISDKIGGRTYIWKRREDVLSTMTDSDLSIMTGSKFVYADIYDWPHNAPALERANTLGIPVFLNLEDLALVNKSGLDVYSMATVIQIAVSEKLSIDFASKWAKDALDRGIGIVMVTGGPMGVHYYSGDERFAITAPDITLTDSNGAGAIYSSAFLSGHLKNMSPIESVKFGVAISSLSCEAVGTDLPDINDVDKIFRTLTVTAI